MALFPTPHSVFQALVFGTPRLITAAFIISDWQSVASAMDLDDGGTVQFYRQRPDRLEHSNPSSADTASCTFGQFSASFQVQPQDTTIHCKTASFVRDQRLLLP